MKKLLVSFLLALIAVFLVPQAGHAQAKSPLPQQTNFTEPQLEERFNQILAEKLDADDVYLSLEAVRLLELLVRGAAVEIIKTKKLDDLPMADANFKTFAAALTKRAVRRPGAIDLSGLDTAETTTSGEIKITVKAIDELLDGKPNPLAPLSTDPLHWLRGLCPLFPICK